MSQNGEIGQTSDFHFFHISFREGGVGGMGGALLINIYPPPCRRHFGRVRGVGSLSHQVQSFPIPSSKLKVGGWRSKVGTWSLELGA